MRIRSILLAAAIALPTSTAAAQSVQVSYTVSGSAGNWLLDFSVFNNIGAGGQKIYFFGTSFGGAANIVGIPATWINWGGIWTNAPLGGSSTLYDNVWQMPTYVGIPDGSTLSGFQVNVNTVAAPTSVKWFAFQYTGASYYGADAFSKGSNPGFEGIASPSSTVPEPSSVALIGIGLAALGLTARKRRKTSQTV